MTLRVMSLFITLALLLLRSLAYSADVYEAEDVVVRADRIKLDQEPSQIISVEGKTSGSRPSLDTALQGQSNIQVVPTPLRGSNLSLGGLSGEHVGVFWNGDPVLGRVDGALDTRMVSLDSIERIAVYQGIDSLPYGSQNIAGVVSLESPWESERQIRLRTAGGNYGRSILSGQFADSTRDRLSYSASASNWRTGAIRTNPDAVDTSQDASARISAGATASKLGVAVVGGKEVDVRVGGTGFHDNSKGVFGSELTEGNQQRVHVYGDLRRGKSIFHLSYSEYKNELVGLGASDRHDTFNERAFRLGPEFQESFGNETVFVGSVADIHSTDSSRISATSGPGSVNTVTVGSYAGARHAFNEHWVAGLGTRWDTGPHLFSPRGEIRYLFQTGTIDHQTVLETGLGFREVTPKEQYMDFANPALRYRVVGNPNLLNEQAWMTALRHTARTKKLTLRGSIFQVRVHNAIGYQSLGSKDALGNSVLTYSNVEQTLTHGAQAGVDYRVYEDWKAGVNYQWLRGRDLANNSGLFLQPTNRIALTAGRDNPKGFSLFGQAVWTSRQGFFDGNRNRVIDGDEWMPAYWSTNLEAGFGFNWSGVSNLVRIFGRVDNLTNSTSDDNFFTNEPRTFLLGALVEL